MEWWVWTLIGMGSPFGLLMGLIGFGRLYYFLVWSDWAFEQELKYLRRKRRGDG